MNALAGNLEFPTAGQAQARQGSDNCLTMTPWGYIVGNGCPLDANILRYSLARFFGIILFMSGLVIGLLPDGEAGSGLIAMKLGAMVMFMLLGAVLFRAGRERPGIEMHVDLKHNVIRLGGRDLSGTFSPTDILRFDEVQSVFLLRNANTSQPARLFLRLGDNVAIEISQGGRQPMERLRQRITYDLTYGKRAA
ncbi:hypothetical protein [Maritimibacter sp. UBA3975]|mgnify:CR=1 FL=1|uniref:hypothetical protein n=1 Tax=Maritimibacter sp. UBA3975 TaxID=1946833 RepID=UPI000C0A1C5D|nr:hypothetical protein [Maritimibacter sp. UBA3975]MAM60203.1 hypothetical protein [Maritimibacter sp.]|tara:strand:+ start:5108 stop:5689 length:582 start_codon:yes stop_codon:yes gene_type:complete